MKRQRGYSLIEVIVAFALLALALTLLLGTLSGAARQVRASQLQTLASLHAQSLLAAQGVETPLQPGTRSGVFEDGRLHWQLDVAPFVDPRPRPPTAGVQTREAGPVLLQLQLQVRWGEGVGEQLRWRTLRLVTPAEGGR